MSKGETETVEGNRIAALEEALGIIVKPLKGQSDSADELEYSPAELKKIIRDKIIFESAANRGASIPEIYEILREKGYPACQKTIWTVLHSDRAAAFTEELERVQLRDIAMLKGYALRDQENPDLKAFAAVINARGIHIRNMKPNDKVKVEVDVKTRNETTVLLREYSDVLQAASVINTNISAVRVGEQVDSEASSSGNGQERSNV